MDLADHGTTSSPLGLFCARLRRLQTQSGIRQAGLLDVVGLKRSQLSDILNGKIEKPPGWGATIAIVRACLEHAKAAGRLVPPDLSDEAAWQRRYFDLEQDLDRSTRARSRRREPAGRPLGEVIDPFALEVHRPVDVAREPGSVEPPILPVYVPREHDRHLADVVSRARDGGNSIVVLVGGSSTGKTRACWEALHALPPGWRLWHPIFPDRAEAFLAGLKQVEARTVVWLNDAQFYLLTGDPVVGEQVAAGLRDLLRDPQRGPVLVLGTIWPEYWQALTATPARGDRDPHDHARKLLTGAAIDVPETFSGQGLAALAVAAQSDPRLSAARQAPDGHVTQFLAGAPVLLERYRTAPPVAKAVVNAALDARMLGHGQALPHALLEAAAPGYLTDQQWEEDAGEDWLEQALAYTAAPCQGARGPLTRIRPRPGQPVLAQPHYRVADYLEQTRRADHQPGAEPTALWDALLAHARKEDLARIAFHAECLGLYRYAFQLYVAAARAGDSSALYEAAVMLEDAGRAKEAITAYQQAAGAGDAIALRAAAEMLQEAGQAEEAIIWLQSRAAAGDARALRVASGILRQMGRAQEAIIAYQETVEAGDAIALCAIAEMLQEAGKTQEAIDAYRQAAKLAARTLAEEERTEEVTANDRRAAVAHITDLAKTARSVGETTRPLNAANQSWSRFRSWVGGARMLDARVRELEKAGRTEEAAQLLRYGIEPGGRTADPWEATAQV